MFFIDELWHGNIRPSQKAIRKDSEYHKTLMQLSSLINSLLADFNEGQRKLYNEIESVQGELNTIENKENFVDGFRYGAGMMLDVISEYKGQLCQISEE